MAGHCPEWYLRLKAARFLGVPPWELDAQPLFWQHAALEAVAAENAAIVYQNRNR